MHPVFSEQPGIPNVQPEVVAAIQQELLPRATLATPNRSEAAQLTGMDEILTIESMEDAARQIFGSFGCPTVITGGGLGNESVDVYAGIDGISHFTNEAIPRRGKVFGAGCTYAAGITTQMAKGEDLRECIWAAKSYGAALIASAPEVAEDKYVPLCHSHSVDSLAQSDEMGVTTRAFRRKKT